MKKKPVLYLTLVSVLLLSVMGFVPMAQAQQDDLDSTLAKAAAKSFLITLLRPELNTVRDFYLLDSVDGAEITAAMASNPATDFEITASDWVSDVTYQVKAILQPGNRPVAVYAGKYDGRWRIEGIDLSPAAGALNTEAGTATTSVSPAIAPVDNGSGRLVFQNQSGGGIYLINADGTGLRQITTGIDPQLSPDGSKIAFTRWEPRYELFTINVDGTGEQALLQNLRQMKSPTWAADGSKLTVSYQRGGRLNEKNVSVNLLKALLKGEDPTPPSEARDIEVENGILTYRIPADAHWYLKQLNLNTGELTDLITERHSYGPTAHPTQANLVIHKGNNGIAINNTDTDQNRAVSTDHRDHTPVISPDGSKVAVSYWQDGHWEVHTMNIDGSNRQRLTETPLTVIAENNQLTQAYVEGEQRVVAPENPHWNNAAPTWSPDGSKIAFLTDRTGRWEIWIMNADGSDQRPMFPNGALDSIEFDYAGVDERMLSWR